MANQARVTSTEALELFRANLVVFLTKARRSVSDVGEEVRRTRIWLQHDQRVFWESEIRRRAKALAQAQQELMSARMGANSGESASMVRQATVNKLTRDLAEAEDKLRRVKKWNQGYDSVADPIVRRLESLREFLDSDLPKAITYLANAQKTLEAYANSPVSEGGTVATPPAPEESETQTQEPAS